MLTLCKTYLAVMAGGAIGVAARMAISQFISMRFGNTLPWGTMLVNVSGCFIIGLFSGWADNSGVSPLVRQIVMIGVLGGFTTFSSFSLQTIVFLKNGQIFPALTNVFLSVLLCLLATWAGLLFASYLPQK